MNRDKCCAMIPQPGDPTGENAQECGALADVILKEQPFCASCALPIWQEMLKDRDREILEFIGKSLDNLASLIHSQFSVPRMTAKRLIVRAANLEPLHKCVESKQSGCCLICDKPLSQIREQQIKRDMELAAIHLKNLIVAMCTLNNLYPCRPINFLMNSETFKQAEALIAQQPGEKQ